MNIKSLLYDIEDIENASMEFLRYASALKAKDLSGHLDEKTAAKIILYTFAQSHKLGLDITEAIKEQIKEELEGKNND